MRKSIVAAFAAALLSTSALAADKSGPPPIAEPAVAASLAPSCYVQALAGSSINSIKAKEADYLPVTVSATGWTVGAGVGCDIKLERVVIGALARIELPVETDGSFIKSDQSWMVGGRIGYLLNTGLMIYGLAGYTQSDWRVEFEKLDRNGLVLGGGLEIMINKQLSLTAEYTRTGMGEISPDPMIKLEPVNHSARLGLSYRFNNPLFGD